MIFSYHRKYKRKSNIITGRKLYILKLFDLEDYMSKNKFKVVYKNNLFTLNILFIYLKNIYLFIFNIFFQTFLGAKLSFSVLFFWACGRQNRPDPKKSSAPILDHNEKLFKLHHYLGVKEYQQSPQIVAFAPPCEMDGIQLKKTGENNFILGSWYKFQVWEFFSGLNSLGSGFDHSI